METLFKVKSSWFDNKNDNVFYKQSAAHNMLIAVQS